MELVKLKMKKNNLTIKEKIVSAIGYLAVMFFMLMGGLSVFTYVLVYSQTRAIQNAHICDDNDSECKSDYNIRKQDNSDHPYSGWQMACNYTGGSDAKWHEETQSYGDQKYLDCANGQVYQYIGISPSVTYFNPDDKQVNEKWCKDGEVATFQHENPITKSGEGKFDHCLTW